MRPEKTAQPIPSAAPAATPKDAYSAAELAGLPGMPQRPAHVARLAGRQAWPHRQRAGRGGGREYLTRMLPPALQTVLAERAFASAVPAFAAVPPSAPPAPVAAAPNDRSPLAENTVANHTGSQLAAPVTQSGNVAAPALAALAQWQLDIGTARAALLDHVDRLAQGMGVTRAQRTLARLAKAGELTEELAAMVRVANARRGKRGRAISAARLAGWKALARQAGTPAERIARLAPRSRGKQWIPDNDVIAALALYRAPNKPALAWCVRQVIARRGGDVSSLEHRCRRAIELLPNALFYAGRNTGAALKALRPFRRREFLSLAPNDVWVGDGHGAKLKVAHPVTGNPFVPEVTAILDVATRYCVGWSVALSENCIAVSDALRHGVARNGIPLIYYSDNGGGQSNKMFDAPITGTLGALGICHETGIPGNPQGRGVIERFWSTVLISLAARFATFQGKSADRDTLKNVSREIDRALRAAKTGEVTALPRKLPTWQQFLDALAEAIDAYNTAHRHSSLPKLQGAHATPAEYRAQRIEQTGLAIHRPEGAELATLFMPAVQRRAERGEVKFLNGIYFHSDLMLVDGESVQVVYDIHDCSRVWVKKLSGEFIAEAVLDGNRVGYFPQPFIERLREERAGRRMGLLESKMDEVRSELGGAPGPLSGPKAGPALEPLEIVAEPEADNAASLSHDAAPHFDADIDLYRWMLDHPDEATGEQHAWIAQRVRESGTFASQVADEDEERLRAGRRGGDGYEEALKVAAR